MIYVCEVCKHLFQAPPSQHARFCNRKCYDKSREGIFKCDNCGKIFRYFKSHKKGHFVYCSSKCQKQHMVGTRHPCWRGRGYRKIVEKLIGRKLLASEIVHHINGNHFDNQIDNLMITNRAQHTRLHMENSPFKIGHKPFPRPKYNGR